ncbi:MAG TPA: hypothetical protein ENL34_07550 [Chloroflexi bacterium]|nr:hypothetical protein [Chloroflexota bacterium]
MTSHIVERILDSVEVQAAQAKPKEILVGAYWTCVALEVEGQVRAGLSACFSSHAEHHHGGPMPMRWAGNLLEHRVPELAHLALSRSLLEASVGFATINALLEVDEAACVDVNAADVIAEHGAGRAIAVVGHFPFVSRLRQVAQVLWVLELVPREGDLPAERAPEILPQADVVAITGTSLLNGTFETLVEQCRRDAFVIVLGATTPMSPVLFDFGVDAISGTRVSVPKSAMRAVAQGATFRQIPGKRLLTMFRPGVLRGSTS